tara:strand:- start:2539 stop:3747 length:1209 start_codon:yes stop_codon:yes gene_type:complete
MNINKDENGIYHFKGYLRKLDTDGFDPMSTYNSFFRNIACEINGNVYKLKLKNNVSFLSGLDISETFSFLNYLQEKINEQPFDFEVEVEFNEANRETFLQGRCFFENQNNEKEPFEKFVSKMFYQYSKENKKYDLQKVNEIKDINNLEYLDLIIDNKKYKLKLNLFNSSFIQMNKAEKKALTEYVKETLLTADEIYVEPHMPISGNILGDLKLKFKNNTVSLEKKIKDLIDNDPTENHTFNYLEEGLKFEALVSKVIDGDTVKIFKNGKRKNVRLANIDAPEIDQAYGVESKKHLANLIGKNKHIYMFVNTDMGKYKRIVATIDSNPIYSSMKESINRRMVKDGMAYSASKTNLFQKEEDQADIYDKGLWYGKPTKRDNPENFRKQKKENIVKEKLKKFGKK